MQPSCHTWRKKKISFRLKFCDRPDHQKISIALLFSIIVSLFFDMIRNIGENELQSKNNTVFFHSQSFSLYEILDQCTVINQEQLVQERSSWSFFGSWNKKGDRWYFSSWLASFIIEAIQFNKNLWFLDKNENLTLLERFSHQQLWILCHFTFRSSLLISETKCWIANFEHNYYPILLVWANIFMSS